MSALAAQEVSDEDWQVSASRPEIPEVDVAAYSILVLQKIGSPAIDHQVFGFLVHPEQCLEKSSRRERKIGELELGQVGHCVRPVCVITLSAKRVLSRLSQSKSALLLFSFSDTYRRYIRPEAMLPTVYAVALLSRAPASPSMATTCPPSVIFPLFLLNVRRSSSVLSLAYLIDGRFFLLRWRTTLATLRGFC